MTVFTYDHPANPRTPGKVSRSQGAFPEPMMKGFAYVRGATFRRKHMLKTVNVLAIGIALALAVSAEAYAQGGGGGGAGGAGGAGAGSSSGGGASSGSTGQMNPGTAGSGTSGAGAAGTSGTSGTNGAGNGQSGSAASGQAHGERRAVQGAQQVRGLRVDKTTRNRAGDPYQRSPGPAF